MVKLGFGVLAGILATSFSLASVADEVAVNKLTDHTGWYIGGSIGHVDSEAEKARNFDSSGNAFGVYGGYNFSKWLGLEMDFQASEDIKEDVNLGDGSRVKSVYYAGFSVMPKATWQINDNFALFGKAGMAVLSYTEESRRSNSSYRYRHEDTWTDLVPGYAVGAEVSTNIGVKIRLAYTAISGDLEYDDDYWDDVEDIDAKFETLTLGVHYQF